jgi:hypothetical protein
VQTHQSSDVMIAYADGRKLLFNSCASASVATFAQLFRSEINRHVEYSFDEDLNSQGTMIVGTGEDFLAKVQRFSKLLPHSHTWAQDVETFVKCTNPPAYFFRVDGNSTDINDVTFYSRFFTPIDEATLTAALSQLSAFNWTKSSPHEFGYIVESEGPQGVGLRIDANGGCSMAVYYDVNSSRDDFCNRLLNPLVTYLGWNDQVVSIIHEDIFSLYPPGKIGVIGLGINNKGSITSLKLDANDIALDQALSFIANKGTPSPQLSQLTQVLQGFCSKRLNYVGIKYSSCGFSGWKCYIAVQPSFKPTALRTQLYI